MTSIPVAQRFRAPSVRVSLGLVAIALVTTLVYLPGLNGPFLFDDPPNLLHPLSAWLNGDTGWPQVIFGNGSGLLGRSVSMLTFLGNASISGLDPKIFKATNLAIHLLCGVVIYALLSRLIQRDPQLHSKARLASLLIAGVWLVHPMQVSTVLYIVQRMAQLSALFVLMALLAYTLGRFALLEGRLRAGLVWLFLAVPAATAAGIFSKENGALAPLLCAVIELGYFRSTATSPRPYAIKGFFIVFLLAPMALIVGWYTIHWKNLADSYAGRLFSLDERLMTQPRALMDYIGALLVPRGEALGLYTDDYPVSRALLDPPSTLIAILAIGLLVVLAWFARTRVPALFAGIGFFLAAHAMESTVFPLELYFEHRNYLPSVGVFLALAGVFGWLLQQMTGAGLTPRMRQILLAGAVALFIVLGVSTWVRASIWSSFPSIAAQGVATHPNSLRAHLDWTTFLMGEARYAEAKDVFQRMGQMANPAARNVAAIDTVLLECIRFGSAQPESIDQMHAMAGTKLQLFEMLAYETFRDLLKKQECEGISKSELAAIIAAVVDATPQPPTLTVIWRSRFSAAELYLRDGQTHLAQEQAALAWMSGAADPAVGVLLTQIYIINGDKQSARLILDDVKKKIQPWDTIGEKIIADIDSSLGSGASSD